MKILISWIVFITLSIITYNLFDAEYNTRRPTPITVIDKMMLPSGRGSADLSIIYKTADGIVFDRYVSPSTYATSHIGDSYSIMIRPRDVKQTPSQNLKYEVLPIFLTFVSLMGLMMTACCTSEALGERRERAHARKIKSL